MVQLRVADTCPELHFLGKPWILDHLPKSVEPSKSISITEACFLMRALFDVDGSIDDGPEHHFYPSSVGIAVSATQPLRVIELSGTLDHFLGEALLFEGCELIEPVLFAGVVNFFEANDVLNLGLFGRKRGQKEKLDDFGKHL